MKLVVLGFILFSLFISGCAAPVDSTNDDAGDTMEENGDTAPDNDPLPPESDPIPTFPDPEPEPEPEPEEQGNLVEIDVTAKQWEFNPSTITVSEGDTVVLNVTSIDVTHGFTISQFGVSDRLNSGQTTRIEFVADKKGTFTFFCSVFCGSGHGGMRGTLIVN